MAAKKKPGNTATVTVFVPQGHIRRDELLQTALLGADIPPGAYNVKPQIDGASAPKTSVDGTIGRDYTITVTWTRRGKTAPPVDEPENTVEQVLKTLQPLDLKTITEHTEA